LNPFSGNALADKYSYSVDVDNPTTSHRQAVLLVAPGSTVLDIGAADGSVARPLVARGCRVWGIERDPVAAAKARVACERVLVGDVEEMDLQALLEGQRFDHILFLDVLEHLRDPLTVLTRARDHLAPGGRVIASIPNIAHGAVRLKLMAGAFTYTETGLLDKTHLHFFDRPGAEALFADARLRIVERLRVTRELTETEIPIDPSAVPPQLLQQLRDDVDATTYQFIFVAAPADSTAPIDGASLAERLQQRVMQLETTNRELQVYARSLEQQTRDQQAHIETLTTRAATLDEITAELERRMAELSLRHVELRHLQADLAVKEAFIADLRRTGTAVAQPAVDAHQQELEAELAALRRYVDSAGFRLVERVIASVKRVPWLFRPIRSLVRMAAGKPNDRP
jgi:2-polyprenyl-3-methyl-5-hydroxy-6-metoxy-1,4-benzoquinol methylase